MCIQTSRSGHLIMYKLLSLYTHVLWSVPNMQASSYQVLMYNKVCAKLNAVQVPHHSDCDAHGACTTDTHIKRDYFHLQKKRPHSSAYLLLIKPSTKILIHVPDFFLFLSIFLKANLLALFSCWLPAPTCLVSSFFSAFVFFSLLLLTDDLLLLFLDPTDTVTSPNWKILIIFIGN